MHNLNFPIPRVCDPSDPTPLCVKVEYNKVEIEHHLYFFSSSDLPTNPPLQFNQNTCNSLCEYFSTKNQH